MPWKIMSELPFPPSPSTFPMSALVTPGAISDPFTVDRAAEYRARAMRAVPLTIFVAGPGEILLDNAIRHACKRGMGLVDAGIEHRDHHAFAGEGRGVRLHGREAPHLLGVGGIRRHRPDQRCRHDRGDGREPRLLPDVGHLVRPHALHLDFGLRW